MPTVTVALQPGIGTSISLPPMMSPTIKQVTKSPAKTRNRRVRTSKRSSPSAMAREDRANACPPQGHGATRGARYHQPRDRAPQERVSASSLADRKRAARGGLGLAARARAGLALRRGHVDQRARAGGDRLRRQA